MPYIEEPGAIGQGPISDDNAEVWQINTDDWRIKPDIGFPGDRRGDPPSGAAGETGSVATTPFDLGGTLGGLQTSFFGNDAVDARYTYQKPAGAWSAGTGPTGNPLFQLRDEAGNIVEWAIDSLGAMIDVKNLGPAGTGGLLSQDPRDNYTAPKGATAIGQDTSTGNPLFQLIDEAGNLVQWGIDKLGAIVGLENKGAASPAAPAAKPTVTPPAATTPAVKLPGLTNPTTDLLSNILTGDNKTPSPSGLTITNNTNAPINTATTYNQITNTTSSTIANAAGQFNDVLKQITGIFSATNDSALTRGAAAPGRYQANREQNWSRSIQGGNVDTVATVKGQFLSENQNDSSKLIIVGTIIAAVTLLVMLFRKRG